MADLEKQAYVKDSIQEPPVPAPGSRRRLWRPLRGCYRCCCGCFRFLFLIAAAAVILTGFAILIFTIVINPHEMKFHVTDASLARFDYSEASQTLIFKLNLNITIRNTNKKIGIHFYATESRAYYDGEELDSWESNMSFYLPPRSSTGTDEYYGRSYEGRLRVSLSPREIKRFNKRKNGRVFPLVMKFRILNAFKVGKMHIGDFRNKVVCRLKIPVISSIMEKTVNNVTRSTGFKDTKCEFYFNPFIVIYTE